MGKIIKKVQQNIKEEPPETNRSERRKREREQDILQSSSIFLFVVFLLVKPLILQARTYKLLAPKHDVLMVLNKVTSFNNLQLTN